MSETPFLHKETTDTPVRGFMDLPSGEVAVVLDGGRVLVCKLPRLLDAYSSKRLLEETARRLQPEAVALAALSNINGPDTPGPGERIAQRREETTRMRDRKVVATIVDIPEEEIPEFARDAIGLGTSDVQRRARTESLGRDIPDV